MESANWNNHHLDVFVAAAAAAVVFVVFLYSLRLGEPSLHKHIANDQREKSNGSILIE